MVNSSEQNILRNKIYFVQCSALSIENDKQES